MNAILITGNTYPHRRELARLGGRWSKDRGGYLFTDDDYVTASLTGLATLDGLDIRYIDADPAELAPPTYADKRAAQSDRHARRADRLEARADSRDRKVQTIGAKLAANPLVSDFSLATEPIKVGHHSEGRHRRAKERIGQQMGAQVQAWREGAELRGRAAAEAARGTPDAERSPAFMVRRMDELTARQKRAERELAGETFHGHDRSAGLGQKPVDPTSLYGLHLTAEMEHCAEGLAYWAALLEAAGGVAYSRETIRPGMVISARFGPARVVRANAKTVSVQYLSDALSRWTSKVPYAEVAVIIEEATA